MYKTQTPWEYVIKVSLIKPSDKSTKHTACHQNNNYRTSIPKDQEQCIIRAIVPDPTNEDQAGERLSDWQDGHNLQLDIQQQD